MDGERRRHARKRISTAVAYREPGGALLRGSLVDISRGGCFIASPSQLTFGETLELELRLPGVYAQITGTGCVVWAREKSERTLPAGMGIRFISVAESSLVAIDGLSGTGARLSQPSTIIGLAPAPVTSLPPPEPKAMVEVEEVPALRPKPRPKRLGWIIAGAVAAAAASVGIAIGVGRWHHQTTVTVDAGVSDVAEVETSVADASMAAPISDASTPDARADGGRDGGKTKPKPKRR